MISRIALFIASLAAVLTLTVALAAAGFAPGSSQPVPASTATTSPLDLTTAHAVTPPPAVIDTIYLAPVPKQETITVKQVVASSGGEGAESGEGAEGND